MRVVAPSPDMVAEAANALRSGELVVVPTETVYGLAAVATNRDAVLKVFAAKGRPADNPLIVHLASANQVNDVASNIPEPARKLAEAFWPGPLTLVLPKQPEIPDEVTAGLDTVAVRVPSHPVMHELLLAVGMPLAAPSANRFMALSPTTAQMVDPIIGDRVVVVLDGGPCEVGIESTVVDCVGDVRILRPGHVSQAQIEAVLGYAVQHGTAARKAPGQYKRHYSPKAPVRLTSRLAANDPGLTFDAPANGDQIQMSHDPRAYAAALYRSLEVLDARGVAEIVVEAPPSTPEWVAVLDRLTKASHPQ